MYVRSTARLEEIKALFQQVPGFIVGEDLTEPSNLTAIHLDDVDATVEGLTKLVQEKGWTSIRLYQAFVPGPKYPGVVDFSIFEGTVE